MDARTSCERYLSRLYFGVFQPSVVCSSKMTPTTQLMLVGTHWQLGKGRPGLICRWCIGRCHVMLMRQSSQGHSKLLKSKICVHNTWAVWMRNLNQCHSTNRYIEDTTKRWWTNRCEINVDCWVHFRGTHSARNGWTWPCDQDWTRLTQFSKLYFVL